MYNYKVIDGHLTNVQYDDVVCFDCSRKDLTTLKGCPKKVNGFFYCSHNKLTTLEGSPKIVNGDFDCQFNQLTTLEGCPEVVNGNFNCIFNNLTSLKGCPKVIKGNLYIYCNPYLEDISDLPESVKSIDLTNCPTIKVFPKHIKDTLILNNITKNTLKKLKQQAHLEIINGSFVKNFTTSTFVIREKPLGQQLLEAI